MNRKQSIKIKTKIYNMKTLCIIDFFGYLSHLKYILKIEKGICIHKNQSIKFDKCNVIYDNL